LSQQKNLAQAMAQLACRTAYKNGTSLDRETMEQIISQWQALRHPQTCPHGRPIVMVLDSNDLSRIFKRNWLIS
jgi:DNA mismatch repair protein MutL